MVWTLWYCNNPYFPTVAQLGAPFYTSLAAAQAAFYALFAPGTAAAPGTYYIMPGLTWGTQIAPAAINTVSGTVQPNG